MYVHVYNRLNFEQTLLQLKLNHLSSTFLFTLQISNVYASPVEETTSSYAINTIFNAFHLIRCLLALIWQYNFQLHTAKFISFQLIFLIYNQKFSFTKKFSLISQSLHTGNSMTLLGKSQYSSQ